MSEYVQKRKQFRLIFEDEDKAGLEVLAKSTSMGKLLGLMDLANMDRKFGPEERGKLDSLFTLFMRCVREWNLSHEVEVENEAGEVIGEKVIPTPRTREGLMEHDPDFVLDLVFAWMDGVIGTPGPLEQRSDGGKPSEEVSIPMETL